MRPFAAALFDLDGTLFDSMWVWDQIDHDFLAKRSIPLPPDYMDAVHTMGFHEAARYTIDRFGLQESPDALMAEWNQMAVDFYRERVSLKPYTADYLQQLHACGVRLGIATACAKTLYQPALSRHNVGGLFELVLSTEEAGCGKSDSAFFQQAAEKLQLPPESCLVFDDDLSAISSAKMAGMQTCAVFDRYAAASENTLRAAADFYIHSFQELLTIEPEGSGKQ